MHSLTKFFLIAVSLMIIVMVGLFVNNIFIIADDSQNIELLNQSLINVSQKQALSHIINNINDTSTFNVINDKGLKIIGNDSKNGLYSVTLKGFTENALGVRTNITLSGSNIPYWKVDNKTYEYNITLPSLSALSTNIKYFGLYFETTKGLTITKNHYEEANYTKEISFCSENSCIDLYFDEEKMVDEKSKQKVSYNVSDNEIKINVQGLTSLNIDPTIQFGAGENIRLISADILTNDTFALNWCDETSDDSHLQIYNITGANLTTIIDVDASMSNCGTASFIKSTFISSFNSTSFVVGWVDGGSQEIKFSVYTSNGTKIVNSISVDSLGTNYNSVQVSALNSTMFVIGWYDATAGDIIFSIYWSNGTIYTGPITVDNNMGTGSWPVSVSTFNSTIFVIGWWSSVTDDALCAVYLINGTRVGSIINADGAVSSGYGARGNDISTLSSDIFVYAWYDGIDRDVTFSTYWFNGTLIAGPIDADTTAGSSTVGGASISLSALNSTAFIIGWADNIDIDNDFAVYSYDGTSIIAQTDVSLNSNYAQYVKSYDTATNLFLCTPSFIYFSAENATYSFFSPYYINGTAWDGICPTGESPPADTCSCAGAATNWVIALGDYCVISTACNITTGNITYTGVGNITWNTTVQAKSFGQLPANQRGYVTSSARLKIQ